MQFVGQTLGIAGWILSALACPAAQPSAGWTQSYDAGYTDAGGAYAGGSEIMHLVPHQGKLYAANGYWTDTRWVDPPYASRQSAQVLRLDAADGRWQVDLDLGKASGLGLRYMKGNLLKSITFTRDGSGKLLTRPKNLLLMASGAYRDDEGVVSAWVRDDVTAEWRHAVVQRGFRAHGIRWIPRDAEVYRDKVTGQQRLFLLIGNPGVLSGVYDPAQPTGIRWDAKVEFPTDGPFSTRPLGMVEANGSLLFSVGGVIYRRLDGPSPTYAEVLDLGDGVNTDAGGIRGLTTIAHPHGPGESVLFLWAPHGRALGQIKRLDPDGSGGYELHDEVRLADLMAGRLGVEVRYVLGAHSSMFPIVHPQTGQTVHLIGFLGRYQGKDHRNWAGGLYGGALYAVRTADGRYTVEEVNGPYAAGKPALVSPRTFARSPFGDDLVFVGGHDCCGIRSDDMAWIFKAPPQVVLGIDRR